MSDTAAVEIGHTATAATANYQAGEDQYNARDHHTESDGQPKPTIVVAGSGWMRLTDVLSHTVH